MVFEPIDPVLDHRVFDEHDLAWVAAERCEALRGLEPIACTPRELAASADLVPCAFSLRAPGARRQATLVHQASVEADEEPPAAVLIALADEAPVSASAHLASIQIARASDGRKAWLRIHDPLVFIHLARILMPAQCDALLGPCRRWTVWVDGRWYTASPGTRTASTALQGLDPARWSALGHVGVVNGVCARLGIRSLQPRLAAGRRVDAALGAVPAGWRVTSRADLVEYASRALSLGPTFAAAPSVRALLGAEDHPNTDAGAAADALEILLAQPDAFWRGVGEELAAGSR